ncbi:hypothetical protein [Sphingomonas sp. Leaf34]|uniref:hypothetical protein n=1 Tax=Sphingomonas sp. Leaf34 TaxID=1736216 RepID=UPI000AAA39AE|nr:hypothetical protein [Sphingomonas sp. Leaf34]
MTYKFSDTKIVSMSTIGGGTYTLAYSQQCQDERNAGYSLRHYPGRLEVSPYTDDCEEVIDFADRAEAAPLLRNFPALDRDQLTTWLSENVR